MRKETDRTPIKKAIINALEEDLGQEGDLTSLFSISDDSKSIAEFLIKTEGVIAGLTVAEITFQTIDPEIEFNILVSDGASVTRGDIVAKVAGNTRSILAAERVALNFLQRMSGIATITRQYVKAVEPYRTKILDTRKTVPGLRLFDKEAVKLGGGQNHRFGLYDAILVKDNHIAAVGSITETITRIIANNQLNLPIEIEVKDLTELQEALTLPVQRILLDNMNLVDMTQAVIIAAGRVPLEASGNVNLGRVKDIAATGVDFISIGALTHSVTALDISLEINSL